MSESILLVSTCAIARIDDLIHLITGQHECSRFQPHRWCYWHIDLMQISPIFECCIRTYGSYGFITIFEERVTVCVANFLFSRVVNVGTLVLQVSHCQPIWFTTTNLNVPTVENSDSRKFTPLASILDVDCPSLVCIRF